ncbi:MAG: hypothetical protein WD875_04895 [Pirellulales bacterium]
MHDFLFIALLTAHLLAVNLAAAGPLVSLVLEWAAARRQLPVAEAIAGRLSRHVLAAFLLGTAIGGAMLALLWSRENDPFVAALLRFSPAKLWFAGAELLFFVVCQAIYVWMWPRPWRQTTLGRAAHRGLAVLAATNLLYHFPPMMVVIADIATGQLDAPGAIDAAAYRQLAFSPGVFARSLHHILAAVSLAGLYAVVLAWRNVGQSTEDSATRGELRAELRAAAWSGRITLVATLLQIPVGVWVLLTLGNSRAVMGDDLAATGFFIAAVVAALGLMHHLAALAFGDVDRKSVRSAVAMFAVVVVLMTTTLVLGRRPQSAARSTSRGTAHEIVTLEMTFDDA